MSRLGHRAQYGEGGEPFTRRLAVGWVLNAAKPRHPATCSRISEDIPAIDHGHDRVDDQCERSGEEQAEGPK
jgi:hypothetical protein